MAKASGNSAHAMNGKMKKIPCKCAHPMQDEMFGKQIRQHNPCNKGYRCTVCGHEKE